MTVYAQNQSLLELQHQEKAKNRAPVVEKEGAPGLEKGSEGEIGGRATDNPNWHDEEALGMDGRKDLKQVS